MNKQEALKIEQWLSESRAGGSLCSCGDFACHNAIHCKNCGTEFKKVTSTTRENLIRRKAVYKSRNYAIRWFVAIDLQLLKNVYGINASEESIQAWCLNHIFTQCD